MFSILKWFQVVSKYISSEELKKDKKYFQYLGDFKIYIISGTFRLQDTWYISELKKYDCKLILIKGISYIYHITLIYITL